MQTPIPVSEASATVGSQGKDVSDTMSAAMAASIAAHGEHSTKCTYESCNLASKLVASANCRESFAPEQCTPCGMAQNLLQYVTSPRSDDDPGCNQLQSGDARPFER